MIVTTDRRTGHMQLGRNGSLNALAFVLSITGAGASSPVLADTVKITISGSGFQAGRSGESVPSTSETLSFIYTYEPVQSTSSTTVGVADFTADVATDGKPLSVAYDSSIGQITGGTYDSQGNLTGDYTDFVVDALTTTPVGAFFRYGTSSDEYYLGIADFTVNVSSAPEPATWAFMLIGVGGLGATLRRRRGIVATA
jgi:MYXO-CTERM domain-containing protein